VELLLSTGTLPFISFMFSTRTEVEKRCQCDVFVYAFIASNYCTLDEEHSTYCISINNI
jgi:hypothetical protein